MNKIELFMYLLKSMILSGIFFGYYTLFLKNTIYHAYNRFYLLASMALSLAIPFFKLSMFSVTEEQAAGAKQLLIYLTQLPASPVQEAYIDWEIIVIAVISSLFVCYLVYSVVRIFRLKAMNSKTQMGEFTFIETDLDEAPFSFFSNLFWKKSISIEDECGRKILQHELSHIREKHSWDRLFSQVICSVFWMNPFNWIIQKELQNIHEFIADRDAVGTGEVDAFAKMLLQTYYGNHFLNPSHSFYYSSIKRRIIMLTTSNVPKYAYLRKVAVLPMLAFILALFSIQLSAQEAKENKAESQSTAAKQQKQAKIDKRQAKIDQKQAVIDQKQAKVDYELAMLDQGIFLTPSDIKSMNVDTNKLEIRGTRNGKDVTVTVNGPNENTTLIGNIELKPSSGQKDNPLIVIDGVISSDINLKDINPNNILSINVLKGEKATAKYAEKGANGVIEITTKKQ
ncbi:MAG: TonB-dependent receptor plug domain-containing protein [Saprospiraceae bacterium]|nr:TonB-dependent receptor plug domain-containing protein [Saprospiraceae bacterium]MDP4811751.1 TonB-dependent receptor plug domain-containing protein [Saprospiraceae bacterium]MDP4814670.1 TonB-dependent receptor plug domain-containing protein [Saprospiraceae bacterium]MDP4913071.1 TonB-dependent receptor plug domain-containing protein [Saprospiraceae bacterium]MDP5047343.1 TonB-dependent receptor plug domain-containing protein [Saprospiraceae bacterium]